MRRTAPGRRSPATRVSTASKYAPITSSLLPPKPLARPQECRKRLNASVCDKTVGRAPKSPVDEAIMAQYKTMVRRVYSCLCVATHSDIVHARCAPGDGDGQEHR